MAAYKNSTNDGIGNTALGILCIPNTQMAKMTSNEFLIVINSFNNLQSKIFVDLERKHGFSRENATYDLYDMSHNDSQKSVTLPSVIEMLIVLHHCYVLDRNHSITDIYRCFRW